jgi:GxxExxY protein
MENLTEIIIKSAFKVHNKLGSGFLERVYENALCVELRKIGLNVAQQYPVPVYYEGVLVGDFMTDIIVNELVIIELKAVENLIPVHEVQLVNYLTATGIDIGLLINFGTSIKIKRKHRVFNRSLD